MILIKEILRKLESIEKKDIEQDEKILLIFDYLKQLEQAKQEETIFKERKRIGFKSWKIKKSKPKNELVGTLHSFIANISKEIYFNRTYRQMHTDWLNYLIKMWKMKNLRFAFGLILGIFLGVSLMILVNCTKNKPSEVKQVPDSIESVKLQNNYAGSFYKLTIDNTQYIIVENGSDGGVAIVRHQWFKLTATT